MSETLQSRERLGQKDLSAELGAVSCGTCVFAQLGCRGKKPDGECPPAPAEQDNPEVIPASQLKEALFNPEVAAVFINTDGGGLVVQPEKAAKLQTPLARVSQPVAKKPVAVPKPSPVASAIQHEARAQHKKGAGFTRSFGELAMRLFGGDVSPRAKK